MLRPLACLLIVVSSGAVTSAGQVDVRPTATVSGRFVRLGDVAQVRAADAETIAAFEQAVLAPVPVPGGRLVLDGETIRSRLRAVGLNIAQVEFTGSSRVTVTAEAAEPQASPVARPASRPLAAPRVPDWQVERAEEAIGEAFRKRLDPADAAEVDVECRVDRDAAPRLLEATSGYDFEGGRAPWTEFQPVTVRFADRRNEKVEIPVEVRIVPIPTVLIARRTLPRGQVVRAEDLAWSRDVAARADTLDDPRDVIGRETTRVLRAGAPVLADDTRLVPLVRRGDVITVTSRVAGIAVRTYATARRDGGLGEQVDAETLDDRTPLVVRVTAFHEADAVAAAPPVPAIGDRRIEPRPLDTAPPSTGIRFVAAEEPEGTSRRRAPQVVTADSLAPARSGDPPDPWAAAGPPATLRRSARPLVEARGETNRSPFPAASASSTAPALAAEPPDPWLPQTTRSTSEAPR